MEMVKEIKLMEILAMLKRHQYKIKLTTIIQKSNYLIQ